MCTASTKRLVEQILIKIVWNSSLINLYLIWKIFFQNMFIIRWSFYLTFLGVNNMFSNSFRYSHAQKYQDNFGSMNIKPFYGNGVSCKEVPLKALPEIWISHNSKGNQSRGLLLLNRTSYFTSNRGIIQ